MEGTLVSARISAHKKEQAVAVLDSLGVTISDLINSAFDYAIEHRELPHSKETASDATAVTPDQVIQLLNATTVKGIDWSAFDGESDPFYKHAIHEGRAADYEALA